MIDGQVQQQPLSDASKLHMDVIGAQLTAHAIAIRVRSPV
jgi:hypothetical protein